MPRKKTPAPVPVPAAPPGPPPPAGTNNTTNNAEGDEARRSPHKSIIFPPDLEAQVEAYRQRNRVGFSKAVVQLCEAALREEARPAGGDLSLADLPPWVRQAVREAQKVTGLPPAAVIIDLLANTIGSYLEKRRHAAEEMGRALGLDPDE